jgi:hypothetical protein
MASGNPSQAFTDREPASLNCSLGLSSLQTSEGWPDWANFCLFGDCSRLEFYENYRSAPNFWDNFFHRKIFVGIHLDKRRVGVQFERFFSQTGHRERLLQNKREIFLLIPPRQILQSMSDVLGLLMHLCKVSLKTDCPQNLDN